MAAGALTDDGAGFLPLFVPGAGPGTELEACAFAVGLILRLSALANVGLGGTGAEADGAEVEGTAEGATVSFGVPDIVLPVVAPPLALAPVGVGVVGRLLSRASGGAGSEATPDAPGFSHDAVGVCASFVTFALGLGCSVALEGLPPLSSVDSVAAFPLMPRASRISCGGPDVRRASTGSSFGVAVAFGVDACTAGVAWGVGAGELLGATVGLGSGPERSSAGLNSTETAQREGHNS